MTVPVRWKPARLSRWISSFMSMRWPAAMVFSERRMNSRGGTRCRMALTVVSTTVGPLRGAGRQAGQRGDAGGDDLGVGADAVVGHRVPGRERDDAHLGREERQALGQRLQPPVVAGHVQQQRRRCRRPPPRSAAPAPAAPAPPARRYSVCLMSACRPTHETCGLRRPARRFPTWAQLRVQDHVVQIRVGQRQQRSKRPSAARHADSAASAKRPRIQSISLVPRCARAIGGAPAARFCVVGHEDRL